MEEWRNGGREEWRNGGREEWRNGGMGEWRNGGMGEERKKQDEYMPGGAVSLTIRGR